MGTNRRLWVSLAAIAVIALAILVIESKIPSRVTPRAAPATAPLAPAAAEQEGPELPEFAGITRWLNTRPLSVADLRGQVVLIDFWTYSCVNCLRTLPYLQDWHRKYSGRGLTIVGVHTPEFQFEEDPDNVQRALQRHGVAWPVAMDNEYETWNAYGNRYWPHKYLADARGRLRYHHIGEGAYQETEIAIRDLLKAASRKVDDIPLGKGAVDLGLGLTITRELYFGADYRQTALNAGREDYLGNKPTRTEGDRAHFERPTDLKKDRYHLVGAWDQGAEAIRAALGGSAQILLPYRAATVNAVVRSQSAKPVAVQVLLDGQPVPRTAAGTDVTYDGSGRSLVSVGESRLYNVVRHGAIAEHVLELTVSSPDFTIFTFTFSPD